MARGLSSIPNLDSEAATRAEKLVKKFARKRIGDVEQTLKAAKVLELGRDEQAAVALVVASMGFDLWKEHRKEWRHGETCPSSEQADMYFGWCARIMQRKLPLSASQLKWLLSSQTKLEPWLGSIDLRARVLLALERGYKNCALPSALDAALHALRRKLEKGSAYTVRETIPRIDAILANGAEAPNHAKTASDSGKDEVPLDAEAMARAMAIFGPWEEESRSVRDPERAIKRSKVLDRRPAEQAEVVLYVVDIAKRCHDEHGEEWRQTGRTPSNRRFEHCLGWAARLLKRKLPFSIEQLSWLAKTVAEFRGWLIPWDIDAWVFRTIERAVPERPLPEPLHEPLRQLCGRIGDGYYHNRQLLDRSRELLGERSEVQIEPGEAWAEVALSDIESLSGGRRDAWARMIALGRMASSASPTKKWSKAASELVDEIGALQIVEALIRWLPLVDKPRIVPYEPRHQWDYVDDRQIIQPHADILRSFCWIAATLDDDKLTRVLGDVAFSCYKKIPGVGPRAVKIGNAAVNALGQIASETALAQLAMLRVKVKFGTAQKLIENALSTVAEKRGLPREEIEELGVPAYGLTEVGLRRERLGEYTCELALTGPTTAELRWLKADGKAQKSVPAAVKRDCADELKEIKGAAKDIQKMLPAQRDRIDSMFLDRKTWKLDVWRERYLDHPLVGVIARRVIWSFKTGKTTRSATWLGETPEGEAVNSLVDSAGEPFEPDAKAEVSLWHPIDAERDEILAWRAFFEDRRIRQPFKQAHREVYLLTDAERNTEVYSNRFAAHVLKQHQFNALCAVRNWKNKLRLLVDAEFPPAHRVLPAWGLRAEYWIEGAGDDYGTDTNEAGVFNYVVTDQVRFYRIDTALNQAQAGSGSYAMYAAENELNEPLAIEKIPPIVLSEILRDVDLFVGVASVGNNPHWADGGPEGRYLEYWHDFSFGELSGTATTRRDVLARLVPRLKIAERCEVGEKFLMVRGDIRTYKIHLGSGNILMEPNDQYLCIVPGQRMVKEGDGKVFLPFEGDRTLAIILSKAFMLADDARIKDPTIVSQIGRRRG